MQYSRRSQRKTRSSKKYIRRRNVRNANRRSVRKSVKRHNRRTRKRRRQRQRGGDGDVKKYGFDSPLINEGKEKYKKFEGMLCKDDLYSYTAERIVNDEKHDLYLMLFNSDIVTEYIGFEDTEKEKMNKKKKCTIPTNAVKYVKEGNDIYTKVYFTYKEPAENREEAIILDVFNKYDVDNDDIEFGIYKEKLEENYPKATEKFLESALYAEYKNKFIEDLNNHIGKYNYKQAKEEDEDLDPYEVLIPRMETLINQLIELVNTYGKSVATNPESGENGGNHGGNDDESGE